MIRLAAPQMLGDFTEQTLLIPNLRSEFRDCAILELSRALEKELCVHDATRFTHAVLDHESTGSAVVGDIALPFASGREVRRLSFALGTSRHGVRWGTEPLPKVHLIALVAAPPREDPSFGQLIVTLTDFLRRDETLVELRRCETPEAFLKHLNGVRCVHGNGPKP